MALGLDAMSIANSTANLVLGARLGAEALTSHAGVLTLKRERRGGRREHVAMM